jgi:hypothetical protein
MKKKEKRRRPEKSQKPNYLPERFSVAFSRRILVYSQRQPGVSTYRHGRTATLGNTVQAHHKRFGEVAAEQTVGARSSSLRILSRPLLPFLFLVRSPLLLFCSLCTLVLIHQCAHLEPSFARIIRSFGT